eukprot:Amastigsp_a508642_106.p4 type:complete len:126 gc:universal Amastigsp_a508642_106:746-369(-)
MQHVQLVEKKRKPPQNRENDRPHVRLVDAARAPVDFLQRALVHELHQNMQIRAVAERPAELDDVFARGRRAQHAHLCERPLHYGTLLVEHRDDFHRERLACRPVHDAKHIAVRPLSHLLVHGDLR